MTVYSLDLFQTIVGINWPVGIADYVILYARLNPPHSVLYGYGLLTNPAFTTLEGNTHPDSVGDWPGAIIPHGSTKRSLPEGGHGSDDPLPILLPTLAELNTVYLWHVGRSTTWGLADQLILNCKKLREDYPEVTDFAVHLPAHTPLSGQLPAEDPPESYDPLDKKPLQQILGIRAYQIPKNAAGGGGDLEFGPVEETVDPFGNLISDLDEIEFVLSRVARIPGMELTAAFERIATMAPITIYNGGLGTVRGSRWIISFKRPKQSEINGYPIGTEEF